MTLAPDDLSALAAFDTPTICNALEVVMPERRANGFNRQPLVCPLPGNGPVVGYARTAAIRCREPSGRSPDEMRAVRLDYYRYVESGGPGPSLAVIEDVEGSDAGLGAFWGEVQSNVHKGLGCRGVVTNGSVRDIDDWAEGFFALAGSVMPSHAWVELVAIDRPVTIHGMHVMPGDLVHADRHGAVVIPEKAAADLPATAERIARKEALVLKAARRPGFSVDDLAAALAAGDDIH